MKIKLFALIALQSIIPLSFAYETGPEIFGRENDMGLCGATRREEYIKIKQTKLDGKFPNIQRFIIDEDWRTQGLDSNEFPLSEALVIENPIKGETLAVFDRNYNKTFRVASFFGRSEIRISEQTVSQGRLGGRSTTGSNDVTSLALLTNDGSFVVVNGCDGVFDVNETVANALVDYPMINGKAFIMISSYGSTGLRINEIGKETVKAWKTIYKNWDKKKDSINKELLFEYN